MPGPPLDDVGGLKAEDFQLISLNGFDPADNEVDKNDYAWAMEYFVPDGHDRGQIYVATGNDMIGLIYQGISAVMGMGELGEVAAPRRAGSGFSITATSSRTRTSRPSAFGS